ncbi:MAG: hypothetical protein ACOX3T_08280 [Bdellovibrionota bacterium]
MSNDINNNNQIKCSKKEKQKSNYRRHNEDVKQARLENAKEIVKSINKKEKKISDKSKRFILASFSILLFIIILLAVILKLFLYSPLSVQFFYSLLFFSSFMYLGTVFYITIETFIEAKAYSLLSLFIPLFFIFGYFSKKIRKLVGVAITFRVLFYILNAISIFMLCKLQDLSAKQLMEIISDNLSFANDILNNVLDKTDKLFDFLFNPNDPRYN